MIIQRTFSPILERSLKKNEYFGDQNGEVAHYVKLKNHNFFTFCS